MGWVWAAKWALDGMLNIYETLFRVSLMVLMDWMCGEVINLTQWA